MEFNTKTAAPESIKVDCLVIGSFEDQGLTASARRVDRATGGAIRAAVASGDMKGKRGSLVVLRSLRGVGCARVALVGLGKSADFGDKAFADAVSAAVRGCGAGVTTLAFAAADWKVTGRSPAWAARAMVTAARATRFRSDELKTKASAGSGDNGNGGRPLRITWLAERRDRDLSHALQQGEAIANGMELAKRLGNLPANVCTPDYLASQARKLARDWGLGVQVLDRRQIAALHMGSFLSVTNGSEQPPRFIVLRYRGAGGRGFADPIALVGKGITFDSGGISLKPGAQMDEMKFDMCGAAAVFGTMRAIAELKPKINVVGVVPSCENLPSGRATKPGDIVTSMSGQTIEILNTDAEGRLILCDALTYAQRFRPAAIIDIATLTGACVVALGNVHSGLFSQDDALAAELLAAAKSAGDSAWRMPVDDDYQEQLKSNFADMANIGVPGNAGAVTAACFLARFVKGQRWAHLDIAGTAYRGGTAKGATGRPVPLLTEFVLTRAV
ncbi:aminopeptidase A, a cyteinylglycinase [Burkholderiales bacterium]|nr:aminopeptidase A, a cyteinylglycinase [Burkholderiales bacterium]